MTVLRQLAIYLTLLLVLLLVGTLVVNISDDRNALKIQLQSNARDTATSLGVAIAATEPGNLAIIDSIIDAVFDSGFYQKIQFLGMDGKSLVNSELPVESEGIPDWFIQLVDLQLFEVTTEVNSGWVPVGRLQVISHPGHAYRSLWSKAKASVLLFSAALLLAIIGLNLLLRIILRPLSGMERQANAIFQRRFEIQSTLPKTREFRRVVEAMNHMAGKLEQTFTEQIVLTEELRQQSIKDDLTDLLNRRGFDARVTSALAQGKASGSSFLVVKVSGLDELSRNLGRKDTEALLLAISQQMTTSLTSWPRSFAGRRSESEFAVFSPECDVAESQHITDAVYTGLGDLSFFASQEGRDSLHLAAVSHSGCCPSEMLYDQADQLLRSVQKGGVNAWQVTDITDQQTPSALGSEKQPTLYGKSHSSAEWGEEEWLQILQKVMANRDIVLHVEDVFDNQQQLMFKEVLARIRVGEELLPAEAFLPMVERFDFHGKFDQTVLLILLDHMAEIDEKQDFSLNLSPYSIVDDVFFDWLLVTMKAKPGMARRLVLEVPGRTMLLDKRLGDRVDKLVETGCRFCIDRFGIASQTMKSLHNLNLNYLKVDDSFVRDISRNRNNQLYLRTLSMLAYNRDIKLLVQGVETDDEWKLLQELGVQGGQGRYLSSPVVL
ncbi:EAL domain-containing protein [Endozoicomonas sp.]|uniref:bifunctional diguanylate cyclase/phosphodiesterase n=1 Tax=Endozoicomonas sp. TaxID=1892382 RepID=UPI002888F0C6|nr:EAL domain-containing protein [Endozoicomonas sp.]